MASNYNQIKQITDFYLQCHKEVSQIWTREDTSLGIMRWGYTNQFPQSLINLIDQSATAKYF